MHLSICFVQGAKKTKTQEQKTEFQLFCETENIKGWILFWLLPSRRIEKAFFGAPLPVHEREFTKAVGALATPLTGLAIKQYLTYLLVEHTHQVDVYTCREFVGFFKRKLDDETSIAYRDIVRVVKERNSGLRNNDLLVANTMILNPHHWLMCGWDFLVRLVALYHMIMVSSWTLNFHPAHTCPPIHIQIHTWPTNQRTHMPLCLVYIGAREDRLQPITFALFAPCFVDRFAG